LVLADGKSVGESEENFCGPDNIQGSRGPKTFAGLSNP
jgi:hypothetical protein